MKNRDVAHQFFYDLQGSFSRRSMTTSYEYGKYYSYSTVIGKIAETITGKTICIISDNNFSMTTTKHIGELRQACPFDVVYLPQTQGYNDFNAFDVVRKCIENIEYYSSSKLTQKANRDRFSSYYIMLQNTLDIVCFEAEFEKTTKTLDDFRELYHSINDKEKLKEYDKKQAEREAEKQAKLKIELENVLNTHSYIDIIKMAYHPNFGNVDKDLKAKLKQYLNPKNELSFVGFDGEYAITTQGIRVSKKEAITLLKLWKNGKLKHGMTIAHYTVLEVMQSYIKIGCHKIPSENLTALLAEIELKAVA